MFTGLGNGTPNPGDRLQQDTPVPPHNRLPEYNKVLHIYTRKVSHGVDFMWFLAFQNLTLTRHVKKKGTLRPSSHRSPPILEISLDTIILYVLKYLTSAENAEQGWTFAVFWLKQQAFNPNPNPNPNPTEVRMLS